MKKDEFDAKDFNLRWRFCRQTIRFWESSKKKDNCASSSAGDAPGNAPPRDDLSRRTPS